MWHTGTLREAQASLKERMPEYRKFWRRHLGIRADEWCFFHERRKDRKKTVRCLLCHAAMLRIDRWQLKTAPRPKEPLRSTLS